LADDFEGRSTAIWRENVNEVIQGEMTICIAEGVAEDEKDRKNDEEDEENAVWHAKPFAVLAHHSFVLR
jgi:hypothetical protein